MSDVFISYAGEDREHAGTLAKALQDTGWSVWWDRNIITGQSYDQVIERELNGAKSVVVLWSSVSVASEWVKNEAAAGAARGVLVPALIEQITPPLEFRRKQMADLIGWDGNPSHLGFQALREGIANATGGAIHQRPTSPPRDGGWWNRGRTPAVVAGAIAVLMLAAYSAGQWRSETPRPTVEGAAPPAGPTRAQPPAAATEVRTPAQATGVRAQGDASQSTARGEPAVLATTANLLSAEYGGRLLVAPSDGWAVTVDGKEDGYQEVRVGDEAVFGFNDGRTATFDRFGMLIPMSGRNPKEFDLLSGDDSPTGLFRAIGTFHTQNAKMFQTAGWQDFPFSPVTAKYFKVKLRSVHSDGTWIGLYEFRLMGPGR